jgi:hypothetical protein
MRRRGAGRCNTNRSRRWYSRLPAERQTKTKRSKTMDITSTLDCQVQGTTAEPIVFVPDVNVAALEAPSIIDDF